MVITGIVSGSAAAKAGLRPGDAVMALDSMPAGSPGNFEMAIADHAPEPSVELQGRRDGRSITLAVQYARRGRDLKHPATANGPLPAEAPKAVRGRPVRSRYSNLLPRSITCRIGLRGRY